MVVPGKTPDDRMVLLKATCQSMGIDYNAQLQRLKRQHWATVCVTHAVAQDDKVYEVVVIDIITK